MANLSTTKIFGDLTVTNIFKSYEILRLDGTSVLYEDRNITAGNGMTGGGDLSGDISIVLGTPTALTANTTNTVSATSHTHSISTASAVSLSNSSSNGVGTSVSLARADHTHSITGFSLSNHNHTLDSLSNVTISSNSTGEILKWNGSAWVNNTLAEAGIQTSGSYQPLDGDLTSIAGITGTSGLLKKTAANTWSLDTTGYTTNTGTVTSVGLSVPTGLTITNSPIITSGTLALTFASGYSIPTNTKQGQWDSAYSISHARKHSITSSDDHNNLGANTIIGRVLTAGAPQELTATQVRTMINVANGANNYTHPSDGDGSIATALTGATVVSKIVINTAGHVTNTATRNITLADLGFTGASNANYFTYSLPTASDSVLGGVKIGSGISITSGKISVSTNYQAPLGFTPENSANKGSASGYASLDSNSKIPLSQLPDTAKQQTYVVATIAIRNALTGLITGDKCFITGTGNSYIWNGSSWVILADVSWENISLQWTNIEGTPTNLSGYGIIDAMSTSHDANAISSTNISNWGTAYADTSGATSANTASKIVKRDASGNFSAGTITASLSGNATTASNLTGGLIGSIPYQTAVNNTTLLAKGINGQVLKMGPSNIPVWGTDNNTTYSNFTTTVAGLVPIGGTGTTKYLRQDGGWQVPPNTNTTYTGGAGITLTGTVFSLGTPSDITTTSTSGTSTSSHSHKITGHIPSVSGVVTGYIPEFDSSGNIVSSGIRKADVATGGGYAFLERTSVTLVADSNIVSFTIPNFEKQTDSLIIYENLVYYLEEGVDYFITNNTTITLNTTKPIGTKYDFVAFMNIPVPEEAYSGIYIAGSTITNDKLVNDIKVGSLASLNAGITGADRLNLVAAINKVYTSAASLSKYFTIKFNTGTTPDNNLYSFNGGENTTVDIKSGVGLSLATTSGSVTVNMGTPSTLSAVSGNSATGTTHSHTITATDSGAASSIIKTDSDGAVTASNKFKFSTIANMEYNSVSKTIDFVFN